MINKDYLDMSYTIKPLNTAMDFSECALQEALIIHDFKINKKVGYILYLGKYNISELLTFNAGYNLFNIKIELQEDLNDEWYLVCEETKTIVYSPGV